MIPSHPDRRKTTLTYFRVEAIQAYVRHHSQNVLPQFISPRLLFFLWASFVILLIVLMVLGYLLISTSHVPLFADNLATLLL